nr:hypothetical protein [uncultured Pseudodesulfovibrio sp.]
MADDFDGLGLGTGGVISGAVGVSDDGTTVAIGELRGGQWVGYSWTKDGGRVDIGFLGNVFTFPSAISGDGQHIVGSSTNGVGASEAFIWSQATGVMRGLGNFGGHASEATAVDRDGTVVVGVADDGSLRQRAFRWTEAGGMVNLETLSGGRFDTSIARGVNGDGSVVVGQGTSANGLEAFRWTQASGMVGLGDLTGGFFNSSARAVSDDGSVIVGKASSDSGTEAFRWVEGVGMTGLGHLEGGTFGIGCSGDFK